MKAPTKYKGYSIEKDEFIFGNLIESLNEDYIFTPNERLINITLDAKSADEKQIVGHSCIRIVKHTAKAFTGYFDKDRNELYEDDKVVDDKGQEFKIVWHQQGCKWYLECYKHKNYEENDMIFTTLASHDLGNGYLSRKDLSLIKSSIEC